VQPHVAIVDDEAGIRALVRIIAETTGYSTAEYGSGESFLQRIVSKNVLVAIRVLSGQIKVRQRKGY